MSLYSHIHQEKAGRSKKREEKEEDKKGKESKKNLTIDTQTKCLNEVREGPQRRTLKVK